MYTPFMHQCKDFHIYLKKLIGTRTDTSLNYDEIFEDFGQL